MIATNDGKPRGLNLELESVSIKAKSMIVARSSFCIISAGASLASNKKTDFRPDSQAFCIRGEASLAFWARASSHDSPSVTWSLSLSELWAAAAVASCSLY